MAMTPKIRLTNPASSQWSLEQSFENSVAKRHSFRKHGHPHQTPATVQSGPAQVPQHGRHPIPVTSVGSRHLRGRQGRTSAAEDRCRRQRAASLARGLIHATEGAGLSPGSGHGGGVTPG